MISLKSHWFCAGGILLFAVFDDFVSQIVLLAGLERLAVIAFFFLAREKNVSFGAGVDLC